MTHWQPDISKGSAPVYERLIAALENDVRDGRLSPGDRLPPQRELAHRLSLSVGTVSRAYVEAERRGFISSHVGRGSFVADRARPQAVPLDTGPLDMAHNVPPPDFAERWIAEGLLRVRQRADLATVVNYAPPEGLSAVREAGASWLKRRHGVMRAAAEHVIQCNGGQHGLALAFAALARPGDTILCEAATYPGIRNLAEHIGYRLSGVAMDERGIDPEALARCARETGARVLVVIPTLQNPTTITLDAARREEVVEVARAHDLMIVEDEAYRLFADAGVAASFADLAPERTLMVAGVSKAVVPGLRLGYLLPPENEDVRDRLLLGIRAFGYSPPSLGGLVFSQWEQDGTADRIADGVIAECEARTRLATTILGKAIAVPGAGRSLHVWMPMPMLDAERLSARALRASIALTPPEGPIVDAAAPSGVRLCLGGVRSRDTLEQALHDIAAMLTPTDVSAARGLV
ncbi:PLP-dependent aminotransferase family protein [Aurantiacibacter xanthus]|uniref:PLP-dependent aminotransferase family protein n=1 Tax=Aurantiacibacter xanthus TaxID=1784712 RepID=A0A3A1P3I9_9SPHN|nr:PLP-dependent aminotransferase family protein [Aurantiacibacter xanthus]RIV80908.1 PLP-dependent aminotransferase family protein [Aurantiacibacter xanthus]